MMIEHIPTLETALRAQPNSPEIAQRYFKFYLSYVEFVAPIEITLETGRIMKLLCQYPLGLTRDEILGLFYENYAIFSFNKQLSLKTCLEKIIQRARLNYEKYHLTIFYCKENKRYYLKII